MIFVRNLDPDNTRINRKRVAVPGNKAKANSMKPKLLKTLPVGTLISFIGTYN